jgi:hypothetical protein
MDKRTILLTRDSVAAGDDADAPHNLLIEIGSNDTIEVILKRILDLQYLPKIYGGKATWSVAFNRSIAVIAQEWDEPKLIDFTYDLNQQGVDKLHFNYHAQEHPDTVLRILSRFRTSAL